MTFTHLKITAILLIVIAFSHTTYAQCVSFKPEWKKGEKKVIQTQTIEQQFFNGDKIGETEKNDEKIIEIIEVNKKQFVFNLTTENIIVAHISKSYDYIGSHFENDSTLIFQLVFDRINRTIDIADWSHHNSYINGLLDSIFSVIKINNPNDYLLSLEMIEGLKNEFTDTLNMTTYISSLIPSVLIPFRASFGLKSPEIHTFYAVNPFDVSQKVKVESEQYVTSFIKKKKQYTLKISDRYDLTDHVNESRTMAVKILQAINPNEELKTLETFAQKVKSEYTQVHTIVQNRNESWPRYYTQNTILINADWKQEIKQITIKKTFIKDSTDK